MNDKGNVVYIYHGIVFSHERKEFLPFATTWVDLEGIMLSEISQREKDKYCYHCYEESKKKKKKKKQSRVIDARDCGVGEIGRNIERLVKGYKLSFIGWIKPENLMYNIELVVANRVLYN